MHVRLTLTLMSQAIMPHGPCGEKPIGGDTRGSRARDSGSLTNRGQSGFAIGCTINAIIVGVTVFFLVIVAKGRTALGRTGQRLRLCRRGRLFAAPARNGGHPDVGRHHQSAHPADHLDGGRRDLRSRLREGRGRLDGEDRPRLTALAFCVPARCRALP